MLFGYLFIASLVLWVTVIVVLVLHFGDVDEDAARKAALVAITSWAWPLWAAYGLVLLVRYALEPYINKED